METEKNPGHNETEVTVDIERHGKTGRIDIGGEGIVEVRVEKDEIDVVTENADGERTVVVVHEPGHDHGHGGHDQPPPPPPPVIERIVVNENDVKVHALELTGLQIKEAAIAQNVKIELDFVLAEELDDDKRRIIGNNEVVKLHEGMQFSAVRDDDNS